MARGIDSLSLRSAFLIGTILPILSFDLKPDLPLILMQQVAVFDRDNPQRSDKDKGHFTRTGNFINVDPVPLTSELEPDLSTYQDFINVDPVPLTSDLEPDRSTYQDIDHVASFQFLLLTGNFIDHVVYFQFLLLTGNFIDHF